MVLEKEGIISQKVYPITFVSSVSQKIEFKEQSFVYRQLQDQFLHNPGGVERKNGYFIATKERAVADMLYFNTKYYFDNPSLVDWKKVVRIQKTVGYKK